jgi:hypothetical protein
LFNAPVLIKHIRKIVEWGVIGQEGSCAAYSLEISPLYRCANKNQHSKYWRGCFGALRCKLENGLNLLARDTKFLDQFIDTLPVVAATSPALSRARRKRFGHAKDLQATGH